MVWQKLNLKPGQDPQMLLLQLRDLDKYFYIQLMEKKELAIKMN